MGKLGKRIKGLKEKVDRTQRYSLEEACALVVDTASAKFDETVELVIKLGVDPRKSDQNVRGSTSLPNGLGKTIRVAVFAKGEKAQEATDAGADIVGAEDLVEKVKEGFFEFDNVVATPDMMSHVGKIGKILGPRGLMPSPKVGTVTFDVGDIVKSLKAGRAQFRVDKAGIIHSAVGKASFGAEKLAENISTLVHALNRAKPSTSKGVYLNNGGLCLTHGPFVKLDLASLRQT